MSYLPNILSCIRIVLSVPLIFVPVFGRAFCLLYVAAGVTDMLDGALARRLNACSAAGAMLDSIGDIVLVAVCLPRLLLAVRVPSWLWVSVAVIAAVRLCNVICALVLYHRPVLLHTAANKLTGFLLFLLPLALVFTDIRFAAVPVCLVALFAAVQEGHCIRTGRV